MNDPTIITSTSKQKPDGRGRTFLCLCLDESGSMQTVWDETIQSFNTYVENVRQEDGLADAPFTVIKFQTAFEPLYYAVALRDVPPLTRETYNPDGFTALYDAVAHCIRKTKTQMENDDRALLIVLTDGHENSSRETTHADLVKLIAECKDTGNWTFVFLGADPDVWDVSAGLGIFAGNTVMYGNRRNIGAIMAAVSSGTACYYRAENRSTETFTNYDQAKWDQAGAVTVSKKQID